MTVASSRIPAARPKASTRMSTFGVRVIDPNAMQRMIAALVTIGGLKNPYYDRNNMVTFGRAYLGWKARVTLNKLQRKRYQQNGTYTHRGEAAPVLP